MLLLRRFRRDPCSVAAQWVSVLCRQLFSALGADDWVLRLACGENEEAELPDATTAFGTSGENETDERPGAQEARDAARAAGPAGLDAVLPPLASDEVDATPLRVRFAGGGQ